ncbi:TetR/AcrR family transcriptional regulator [Streptomyces sp. NPDC020747]|uniref:TetR/AcrR family transcriptional regulator n=1 Tax=Streptomyces sp. NPDC020747 TaxID=3365086 RepID=UPI0037A7F2AA
MTFTSGGPQGPRQPPTRADARRNYERLLTAASEAFAEHGAGTSLDDIAKRAGVGNATLYRHFPTREALLETVYRDEIQQLSDHARTLALSRDPVDALASWLRMAVSRMSVYEGLKGLLVIALRDEGAELGSWCRDTIRSAAADLLTKAQEAGAVRADIDELALLRIVNAISLTAEQSGIGPDPTEQLISLLLDGLRSR